MLVSISGIDAQGRFCKSDWSLVARKDHGPYVPILPTAAIVKKLLAGHINTSADLAAEHLSLREITNEMKPYDIVSKQVIHHFKTTPFGQSIDKKDYSQLPTAVQRFHANDATPVWAGTANITGATWILPKLVARLFGFPKAGEGVPVSVTIDRKMSEDGAPIETWTRRFADTQFSSTLRSQADGSLTETFWPFTFNLSPAANKENLYLPVSAWRIGLLGLPQFLAPKSQTREYQDAAGRFCFDVQLSLPWLGKLAHYQGWLEPKTAVKPITRQPAGHEVPQPDGCA